MTLDETPYLDENEQTPSLCLACGGEWQIASESATGHSITLCRYCTRGGQNELQRMAWLLHKATLARGPT